MTGGRGVGDRSTGNCPNHASRKSGCAGRSIYNYAVEMWLVADVQISLITFYKCWSCGVQCVNDSLITGWSC